MPLAGISTLGAKDFLLDNRYVNGSSTPLSEVAAEGNTYQARAPDDGSLHKVLKNFPSEAELSGMLLDIATDVRYHQWEYFWALEHELSTKSSTSRE